MSSTFPSKQFGLRLRDFNRDRQSKGEHKDTAAFKSHGIFIPVMDILFQAGAAAISDTRSVQMP